ncbi:MAG TPA: IMP dehydrogenase, partial [Candidatus Acidoferrum sp.]|nr:IMP dehydrogenase [Candidatus Acidoferrum sp.]
IEKLLVVDENYRCVGLITVKDIEKAQKYPNACKDERGRLRVAAATNVGEEGVRRAMTLIEAECDVIVVDTAHGHSKGVLETVSHIKRESNYAQVVAGNVATGDGAKALIDAGADAIKVGIGPGSICTTRIVAGVGIPQMTALYTCSRAAEKKKVSILSDGGITKSGDIVKALTLSQAVICGGIFAGCNEAPGDVVEISGKFYKQYRGMGSLAAMRAGSAARYGHEKNPTQKVAPEGVEALKEACGSVDRVLAQLIGGIQSGMGYLGAANLAHLRQKARYIRVTAAGMREAAPHDVVELKTGN